MADYDEKFEDTRTGENVTRIKVPEKYLVDIDKNVKENAQHATGFMNYARQEVAAFKMKIVEFDKASASQEAIGKEVIIAREKMGLDSSWVFNIPLKMMEKREPIVEEATI